MKNLSVQIEEEVFRLVKIKTARLGISLKDYVLKLIRDDLEKDKENSDA